MDDRELYRRILGIESPWRVASVDLQLSPERYTSIWPMKSFPVGLVPSVERPASCTIINRNGNGATWTPASTAPSCTPTLPAVSAQPTVYVW